MNAIHKKPNAAGNAARTVIFTMVLAISVILFSSCTSEPVINQSWNSQVDSHLENQDVHPDRSEDKSESWSGITEEIKKSSDWKQIVQDSEFQLGEPIIREEGGDKYKILTYGTFPVMNGSTVCVPMAMEFLWQHIKADDLMAKDMAYFTKTNEAYVNLIERTTSPNSYYRGGADESLVEIFEQIPTNLILVTEPSLQELALASFTGTKLDQTPICMDAFVFITHKNNPVDSLTVEQIQGIYSGKIKNWKEVGGNDSEIVAFQRNEGSGSQTTMVQQVMKGIEMEAPLSFSNISIAGMGPLIDAVSEYRNDQASIGYSFKYYLDNQYKNSDIKCIKIDGVSPEFKSVQSKEYPFSTYYYAVIREEDKDKPVGDFVKWIISDEGQACIKQAGYCPLP